MIGQFARNFLFKGLGRLRFTGSPKVAGRTFFLFS